MTVVERTKFWTKERDDFLRANYGPHMHVDPACLALGMFPKTRGGERITRRIINRLSELGLRKKRPNG